MGFTELDIRNVIRQTIIQFEAKNAYSQENINHIEGYYEITVDALK